MSIGQLGMTDIREIERMTMYEYEIRRTAYLVSYLDKLRDSHDQAWANQQIKATKKVGKKEVPYFKDKEAFFDYDSKLNSILGIENAKQSKVSRGFFDRIRKANL